MTAKRGRPAFKPTKAQRKTVEEMLALGDSQHTIAAALGIDDDTLRKYFPNEIANARAKKRKESAALLFKAARKGNVAALKKVIGMMDLADARDTTEDKRGDAATTRPPARSSPLGKKAAAQQEAVDAMSDPAWGDDLQVPPGTRAN